MSSLYRDLFDQTLCNVFTTGYHTGTNDTNKFFFSFVESVVTEIICRKVIDKTLSQNFNRCSRSDTIMRALIESSAEDPSLVASTAAFVEHYVINVFKKELKREPSVAKEISSPLDRFLSPSTGTTLDKECKAWRLRRQGYD